MRIPVVVQYRHVHLSEEDFRSLFGDRILSAHGQIGHFGQFVSDLSVDVHGRTGILASVKILGPFRSQTQVELSLSEASAIGIHAPVRLSGDLTRSKSCTLKGPSGSIRARSCVISPARHLHVNDQTATRLGLTHGQIVSLQTDHEVPLTLDHVTVRVHPTFSNEFHLTSDEAAQHWLHTGHQVQLCDSSLSS